MNENEFYLIFAVVVVGVSTMGYLSIALYDNDTLKMVRQWLEQRMFERRVEKLIRRFRNDVQVP